jgi:hypothetical protein
MAKIIRREWTSRERTRWNIDHAGQKGGASCPRPLSWAYCSR